MSNSDERTNKYNNSPGGKTPRQMTALAFAILISTLLLIDPFKNHIQ